MARTNCLVCLVSTVSGCRKDALGKGSASSGHITKLEQSTFLWISMGSNNHLKAYLHIQFQGAFSQAEAVFLVM
jgi:hypothetical protein